MTALRVVFLAALAVVALGSASTAAVAQPIVAMPLAQPDTGPVEEPVLPGEEAPAFRYPTVFLVPLALLVLAGLLVWTLTQPIPRRPLRR